MGWFSRSKKKDEPQDDQAQEAAAPQPSEAPEAETPEEAGAQDAAPRPEGAVGPFDGDTVDIEEFDFSDFSDAVLDLSSLKIPLPKESQVQVEMGPQGPRMIHIVTRYGRITPVAFAAPRSESMWRESTVEIREGMREQGLQPRIEQGPWGREVVADNEGGQVRIIGIDGPRWLLRFTTAAPAEHAENLAELSREIAARTFVYRGENAILAGSSLPVVLPNLLADQVRQEMQRRAQAEQNGQNGAQPPAGGEGATPAGPQPTEN